MYGLPYAEHVQKKMNENKMRLAIVTPLQFIKHIEKLNIRDDNIYK